MVFAVVDHEGIPISNANVRAGFYMNRMPGKNLRCRGRTDKNGIFVARQNSVGEVNYIIHKDDYYVTTGRIDFRDRFNWEKCVVDKMWQPYGKTYQIILKPKIHPIHMNEHYIRKNCVTNVMLGFDLEKGDFIKPYGKGLVSDFSLIINEEAKSGCRFRRSVILSFDNAYDGLYIKQKDMFSAYVSDYHASTNAVYAGKKTFVSDCMNPENNASTTLSENQYIVLRTRTKINDDGKIVYAHYSKIYGPLLFSSTGVSFRSIFNPKPNDTNLEYEKESPPWHFK